MGEVCSACRPPIIRCTCTWKSYEKWQEVEPRLRKFKNREEFLAYVDEQYQTELKAINK